MLKGGVSKAKGSKAMNCVKTALPAKILVGITARTSNAREMNPSTAIIGFTLQRYVKENIPGKITGRAHPGVTWCVYTEYESDHTGEYTYFVGEEALSGSIVPEGLVAITIPDQNYIKYTTDPGIMPAVVINAWEEIWSFTPQQMGAERSYGADFEIYTERAADPQAAIVDIYIGIKP